MGVLQGADSISILGAFFQIPFFKTAKYGALS